MKDMLTMPAVRDLMSYSASLVLGGDAIGNSFIQSTRMRKAIVEFGFGLNLARHIEQHYVS